MFANYSMKLCESSIMRLAIETVIPLDHKLVESPERGTIPQYLTISFSVPDFHLFQIFHSSRIHRRNVATVSTMNVEATRKLRASALLCCFIRHLWLRISPSFILRNVWLSTSSIVVEHGQFDLPQQETLQRQNHRISSLTA